MSALARFSSFQPPASAPRRPGRAVRRTFRRSWRAGLPVAAVGLLALGLLAASALTEAPPAAEAAAGGVGAWIEIRRPLALYDLSGTDFARRPAAYRARRRAADETREDLLAFGRFGDGEPFLQLSLLRAAGREATEAPDDLADGLARLAGTAGLAASRVHPLGPVDTRLGPVETAELVLRDRDRALACLGFRGVGAGVLRFAGLACGTPARPVSRAAIACAVDRIDLVAAGEDADLRAVFVAAERRGGGRCREGGEAGAGSPLAIGRRGGWLDPDGEMPPLRGLFEAALRQR